MSINSRGRKIKHSRHIYRHRKKNKLLTTIIAVLVIVAIVFVGYSAGRPVVEFFRNKNSEEKVTEWTPESATFEDETTVTTEESTSAEISENNIYIIPDDALNSSDALLDEAKKAAENGYTSAAVTMKAGGGNLLYASVNDTAVFISASTGELTAQEISDIIISQNVKPYARVNVLRDNVAPVYDASTAYLFADESTKWLDNKASNGGKPWLSPFSDTAKAYLAAITDELVGAGFSDIILEDVIFPPFRNSDLNYLGSSVKDENRYKALISVVNVIRDEVNTVGGRTYLYLKASDIINNTSEVYKPDEISGVQYIVSFDASAFADDFSKEKLSEIMISVEASVSEFIPSYNSSEFTPEQVEVIKKVFEEKDYKTILVG